MKSFVFLAALVTLATATSSRDHARIVKRQSSSATSSATSTSAAAASAATTLAGTGVPPLSEITSGAPSESTIAMSYTVSTGATPSAVSGAPPLPSVSIVPSQWPTMDKLPDTSSSEVQEWMKELDGFNIPDLNVTDGTCGGSPAAASDAANRGWWTCGGYTRPTDIVSCPDKLTWGMSFDDGPGLYTPKLLDYLDSKDLLATFFVVGSRVIEFPDTLRDEYIKGHEISVHTWSHPYLTTLTNEQIVAELGWTRKAIQTVLGVTPVTMRPPYGDIDDRVRAISLAMGMVPIIWTRGAQNNQFDTNDWKIASGQVTGNQSVEMFKQILGNATEIDTGFIVLEHDLYMQSVDVAVGFTLDLALNFTPSLKLEPIGTCQGWPESNMYVETTTNTTFPYTNSSIATEVSTTAAARATAIQSGNAAQGSSSGALSSFSSPSSNLLLGGLSVLAGAFLMV